MIINKITINNFQSYFETQTIELSKGLNLIIGNGGKGKSKLFNAFYWAFFGDIYITDIGWCNTNKLPYSAKFSMKKHDFINKRALSKASEGDKILTSVVIELEDDKGYIYEISRSVFAIRQDYDNWNEEKAWIISNNTLKVTYDNHSGTKVKTEDEAMEIINDLFPAGIRNYIWFQGESLDTLINFRNKETLKEAVKHISYFPYYEKLYEIITKSKARIERLESNKLKENNKNDKSFTNIINSIERLSNNIDTEEENKKNLEIQIYKIQIALTESENKITGLASYTNLVNEYNNFESKITTIRNDINQLDTYQREQIKSTWILRGITPLIEESKRIINSYTAEQNTVPEKKYIDNPSRQKLEEIIKDKKCFVCGNEVNENSDAFNWITNRLKEQELYLNEMDNYMSNMEFSKQFERFIGSIQDYPDYVLNSLNLIDKNYSESENKIDKLLTQRKIATEKKNSLNSQIEDIKKKHGVNPITQASQGEIIATTIKSSRSILEKEQKKLTACTATIAKYEIELKAAKEELKKLGDKSGNSAISETEWKHISIFLENICKKVQDKARKELLKKIEERANHFYKKFTEHDNGYKGSVKIGEDYSIEFDSGLNTSHEDRKKMSIINAMLSLNQEAIGTFYPFISDAPTSSFDYETTHKYLIGIKDMFTQSIIMTKDVDINSDNYTDLTNQTNISHIYILKSDIYCEVGNEPELHEVSTRVLKVK